MFSCFSHEYQKCQTTIISEIELKVQDWLKFISENLKKNIKIPIIFIQRQYLSPMKHYLKWLIITLLLFGCSPRPNSLDRKVFKAYRHCTLKNNYVIDFATLIPYDWDTLYFFSGKWELEDIIDTLGIPLSAVSYSDVGPKVFFMQQGHVVYQTGWFPYPPERCPKYIYFDTPGDEFTVSKRDAKFNVTKNGDAYSLKPLF